VTCEEGMEGRMDWRSAWRVGTGETDRESPVEVALRGADCEVSV